jgi:hypothetical protein
MIRIGPPIPVPQQPVRAGGIVVRPAGHRRDGQRSAREDLWLEDALRTQEWDANVIQDETLSKQTPWENVSMPGDLLSQPLEGRGSNPCVLD